MPIEAGGDGLLFVSRWLGRPIEPRRVTRRDQEKARDGQPIPTSVVTLLVSPQDAERIALSPSGVVERRLTAVRRWAQDTKLADGRRVVEPGEAFDPATPIMKLPATATATM